MLTHAQRLLRATQLNSLLAPYHLMLKLQEHLFEQRRSAIIPDTLLRLEHGHAYTMGKRGSSGGFHSTPASLLAAGAEVAVSPRGGETTYHGPGQLVVYPIVSLRELGCGARAYVEGLEDVMVATLGRYGIAARGRVPGKTGVWVGERKIGAVGVRISQGVASHGVALNVATDLTYFKHIVPCGIPDKEVTSIHKQLGGWSRSEELQQQRQSQTESQFAAQQGGGPYPPTAAGAAATAITLQSRSSAALPSLQQVADDFLDAFAAHFGYRQLQPLPDVLQLANMASL